MNGAVIWQQDAGSIAIADIDGDGQREILHARDHSVTAYRFTPGSGWSHAPVIADAGFNIAPLAIGDARNSGQQDIVLGESEGGKLWLFRSLYP